MKIGFKVAQELKFSQIQQTVMLMKVELEDLEVVEVGERRLRLLLLLGRGTVGRGVLVGLRGDLRGEEVGDDGFFVNGFDFADFGTPFGGKLVVVLVACVEVEG